jgi:hypothetical protein
MADWRNDQKFERIIIIKFSPSRIKLDLIWVIMVGSFTSSVNQLSNNGKSALTIRNKKVLHYFTNSRFGETLKMILLIRHNLKGHLSSFYRLPNEASYHLKTRVTILYMRHDLLKQLPVINSNGLTSKLIKCKPDEIRRDIRQEF